MEQRSMYSNGNYGDDPLPMPGGEDKYSRSSNTSALSGLRDIQRISAICYSFNLFLSLNSSRAQREQNNRGI